ncbi:threonylcarbamoyl-AMP synthase [candidate division WOR-3 bacterium]|nr:threonylcarbamoyl-AMP synthase [candidate division WOR-3 bacterium]
MGVILKLDPRDPDLEAIRQAAAVLRQGGTVVFPTETVYGVGAALGSDSGIERVFRLKRRGYELPLLVHCASEVQTRRYAGDWPESARVLARAFWPGPLALVLRRSASVPDAIRAGDSVGLRVVADRVTQELIENLGEPIAGTSANLHGQAATSRFDQIRTEVVDAVDVALDVGQCGEEVASTVLDLTEDPPRVIRAGVVTVEQLEEVLRLRVAGH